MLCHFVVAFAAYCSHWHTSRVTNEHTEPLCLYACLYACLCWWLLGRRLFYCILQMTMHKSSFVLNYNSTHIYLCEYICKHIYSNVYILYKYINVTAGFIVPISCFVYVFYHPIKALCHTTGYNVIMTKCGYTHTYLQTNRLVKTRAYTHIQIYIYTHIYSIYSWTLLTKALYLLTWLLYICMRICVYLCFCARFLLYTSYMSVLSIDAFKW